MIRFSCPCIFFYIVYRDTTFYFQMAPTKFRPQSPGIDSANEVKRPPGVFYFEGAPINRQTIAQSQSAEYRKTLLCGYCGNQLRHRYKCHNCRIMSFRLVFFLTFSSPTGNRFLGIGYRSETKRLIMIQKKKILV